MNPIVEMSIENYGKLKIELYPDKAPETVSNFVKLVKSDFYTGLIFHRVIKGFMIQGGGYNEAFDEKETDAIHGEFRANGFAQNDIKHLPGVISMARTNRPNSASSQFFLMHKASPFLDGQYAAFGQVTEGIEIIDKIANVETGSYGWFEDVPKETVKIEYCKIISE